MPPTDVERIAVLENQSKTYKETLKDIDNKLDQLPKAISQEIEKAIERCREMQSVRCGLLQKQMQPETKTKSNISGWASAITMGIISGIGFATKTLGWW